MVANKKVITNFTTRAVKVLFIVSPLLLVLLA